MLGDFRDTYTRRDWYEVQLWEMRNAGLDSAVWVIGNGPTDYWGPMRYQIARGDFGVSVVQAMWGPPMTYRWIRA